MNPFVVVNEIAVVSTAFLMLAVCTIWYAPAFFGGLQKQEGQGSLQKNEMYIAFARVLAYTCSLFVLAFISAHWQLLNMSVVEVSLLLCALIIPLVAVSAFSQGRSLRMIGVDAVFTAVFIVVGIYVVTFWPW